MHFVDMLFDCQVAMGFTPTEIHFPFCDNLVSLHFCIFSVTLWLNVEVVQINKHPPQYYYVTKNARLSRQYSHLILPSLRYELDSIC